MRRLGVPSATAGIVAAALAACNGAVTLGVVARDSGPESDGGPELDAGVDADDDASTVADAADAGEEDGSQFPLACPACPPPSDPYWDGIFPEAGLPSDASVCGVISAGRLDSDPVARVTRELYEALVLRRGVDSFPCPRAICETGADLQANGNRLWPRRKRRLLRDRRHGLPRRVCRVGDSQRPPLASAARAR